MHERIEEDMADRGRTALGRVLSSKGGYTMLVWTVGVPGGGKSEGVRG